MLIQIPIGTSTPRLGCFLIVASEASLSRANRLESRPSVFMCDPAGLLFDDLASDKNCQGMFAVVLRDMQGWQQMGSWLALRASSPYSVKLTQAAPCAVYLSRISSSGGNGCTGRALIACSATRGPTPTRARKSMIGVYMTRSIVSC